MHEEHHLVAMKKGGRVSLLRYNGGNGGSPVIVTHGTFSNVDTVIDLGLYLANQGFDCWLLEWGGHGKSIAPSKLNNFEYPAFNDAQEAIQFVLKHTNQKKLYWVSHSGGGHLALMKLGRNPQTQFEIAGLVIMGAQATDAAIGLKNKTNAVILWIITKLLGRIPKTLIPLGNEGEPTSLLAQWSGWNLRQKWLGKDGFDYMKALEKISIPALVIAGIKDDIAPATGCRKLYDSLGSSDKSWLLCSLEAGFSKDYTHGQLIRGTTAKRELFPKIDEWLKGRNSD